MSIVFPGPKMPSIDGSTLYKKEFIFSKSINTNLKNTKIKRISCVTLDYVVEKSLVLNLKIYLEGDKVDRQSIEHLYEDIKKYLSKTAFLEHIDSVNMIFFYDLNEYENYSLFPGA